jgi:DNA polymerase-4
VGRRLRRSDLRGTLVRIKVRDPDFHTRTRQHKLESPTWDDQVIYRSALALFDAVRPAMAPVRLLGVAVADLGGAGAPSQGGLFDRAERDRSEDILAAMDKIRDRFGEGAIHHGMQDG